jgi:hypothetical protein
MNDNQSIFSDNKVIVFLGRTGSGLLNDWFLINWIREFYSGKTSLFNLLSNSNQPLGNSVSSTTKEFFYKTSETNTFIDTIGFRDAEDENEHKLKVVLFLKEIRNGFDISMS